MPQVAQMLDEPWLVRGDPLFNGLVDLVGPPLKRGGGEERRGKAEGEERETQMIHIPYLDPIAAQQCGGCGRSQMRVT